MEKRALSQSVHKKPCGIVAFDLDGTVFSHNSDSYPSPRVAASFAAAHEKGYELVIATGRPISHLRDRLRCAPWLGWIIASSGAALYRAGETQPIMEHFLSFDLVKDAFGLVGDAASRRWLDTAEGFVCEPSRHPFGHRKDALWLPPGAIVADDVLSHPSSGTGVRKVMFHLKDAGLRKEYYRVLRAALAGYAEVASEGASSLEVSPKGASKGATAMSICRITGASPEKSIAFGDSGNDLSFVETPLMFVAMESAEQCIREIADDVCPDVFHDGVAVWLEEHILSK